MKNNNKDHQYPKLLSIFYYVHRGLNTALLWKIVRFSICFGVGFQVSFTSNFWGDNQSSSISSASIISQPKTVRNRQIVPQTSPSLLLSQVTKPFATSGRGSLEVSNGTDNDAYIKLVDPLSRSLVAAFYVKSNSTFTLEEIPDGTYEVLFVTGQGESQSFSKFDLPFEFTTTQLTDRIEYSIHRITLNEVVDGNATTSEVDEQEFEQY
jgi:hypothetical protein